MSVKVTYRLYCGGCDAEADAGTEMMRREFRSFSGRGHGFGHDVSVPLKGPEAPEGWMLWDPYTHCTYCPECWAWIVDGIERDRAEVGER